MTRVLTPLWWADGEQHVGWTDAVDAYCCSAVPCWFVEVPDCEYWGYFRKNDLTVVRLIQVRESLDARLPELWEIVVSAEIVERHDSFWATFRWYRIHYAAGHSCQVEAILDAMR